MESYSYSPVDTDKVIHAVHQRPALWDRGDFEHCNARIRNEKWAEVAQELNSTIDAVRSKWKSLRDCFTKILKKTSNSKSVYAEVEFSTHSTWKHFQQLYFLKDQYTPQATSEDVPHNKNKNLRDYVTDTRDERLETLQHNFQGICHEQEQIISNVSTAEISPKGKKLLMAEERDSSDGTLQISQHSLKGSRNEKGQISSHVSTTDIPPKEKKISRDNQKEPRDGSLQTSQRSFKGSRHDKEHISFNASRTSVPSKEEKTLIAGQTDSRDAKLPSSKLSFKESCQARDHISSHVTTADIPYKEKNIRDDQTRSSNGRLKSSQHGFQGLCCEKKQSSSHVSRVDIPPEEKKILKLDQSGSQVAGLENLQHGDPGTELKPSTEVPKRRTGDSGLEIASSSILPNFKHLCLQNGHLTSHADNKDLPHKKRKDFSDIQTYIEDGHVESSQYNAARKKLKSSDEVPERISGDNGQEFSDGSTSLNSNQLCLQENKQTSYAGSKDLPCEGMKTLRTSQTHSREQGIETSNFSAPRKDLKRSTEVPETGSADRGVEFSYGSTSKKFKHNCPQKDRVNSHAVSKDLQRKVKKTLHADQTESRDGGPKNSQYDCSEKELRRSADMPERRCDDDRLQFPTDSNLPTSKNVCIHKHQLKTHHIPPKENKTSRDNQTDTREENLENSRTTKFCNVPMDISDAPTEASCPPPSSIEKKSALSVESPTTKYSTRSSSPTDAANSSAVDRPILKVSGDEQKSWDEDTSFFQSLIPHVMRLSPERKMLLRIKTQELIYNHVYKNKV
jgi:hypothetical protein